METIDTTSSHLEVFVSGKEYFALLRPSGMLCEVIELHAPLATSIEVKKMDEAGAIFRFPAAAARVIVAADPRHSCDDRLRYLLAHWVSEVGL